MDNAVTESREMDELEAEELFTEEETEEKEEENEDIVSTTMQQVGYTVTLSKEYDFNGKKIKEIDLSGLEDLTTMDAEKVDRAMVKINHYPRNKFRDTTYCKHIAMRASGLPEDFFNLLRWKDMTEVTSRVAIYFLFG